MRPYRDSDNNSNILGYEYGEDWIRIYFKNNSKYEYQDGPVGQFIINKMKYLADQGDGLNAFINEHKPKYSSKNKH